MNIYPNFFVLGASKAGTTSLHHYLLQHPQIYMAQGKETYYFNFLGNEALFQGPGDEESLNKRIVRSYEEYQERFSGVTNQKAVGEICGPYLSDPKVPKRIHEYNPHAKLIAILRNPVDRAYSAYMHVVREGHETIKTFDEALRHEDERFRKNWRFQWHFTRNSMYYEQVKRYKDLFPSSQFKIYLYEADYKKNPKEMMKDMFSFLEVDDQFSPDMNRKHNITGLPKSETIRQLVDKPNILKTILRPLLPSKFRRQLNTKLSKKNLDKPEISAELRKQMVSKFRDDILKLQDLIKRDLSSWLT